VIRKAVATLLQLFPKRFRNDFAADMLTTFEDRWREQGGVKLAARTVVDLATSAAIEHGKGDNAVRILWQDMRFAIRGFLKAPGFAVVAVITLALGIGVNTAMFSVANAVLWKSLPYPDPARIVWIGDVLKSNPDAAWGTSYLNFLDWHARAHSFEKMAGTLGSDRILVQGSEPTRVTGLAVSHDFFELTGARPAIGRGFDAADEKPGSAPVILLSEKMWRQRFGADASIVGRPVKFDDAAPTVIGILPEGFEFRSAEYFVPLDTDVNPYFATHRDVWVMNAIGRLHQGVTPAAAQAEMEGIGQQMLRDHPELGRGLTVRVNPLRQQLSRDLEPAVVALLGAVAVVLLIACANLAGLMSVRASGRVREMAIRSALGAGRQRMIRQLMTECFTLAVCGGVAGIALAGWATRGLQWLSKDPRLTTVPIDMRVLAFAIAATLITSFLFGVAPAIRASRTDAAEALKSGPRTGGGPRGGWARQALVVAQVALCLTLLAGAGLLFRSFEQVMNVNPGFRTEGLSSMRVALPASYKTVPAVLQAEAQFIERVKSLPGVANVTMVNSMPISGGDASGDITIDGIASRPGELGGTSFRRTIPGYFSVMGIPLLRGRDFNESDDLKHEQTVIISEAMAKHFWQDSDPLGGRIKIGPRDTSAWLRIIGVVKDVRHVGLDSEAGFATYQPLSQQPRLTMELAIQSTGDSTGVLAAAQRELRNIEPGVLIDRVKTMSQRIDDSVAPRRLNLVLFGLFAGLALVLASVGLYGVVAYAASQRTQEFGIRMALGAQSADVLRMVLGHGLRLALIGVAIGIAGALAAARVIGTLLFGVQPYDPLTLTCVALVVTVIALAACWLPARRATKIAPTVALRAE
jgi:predicted permease